MKRINILILMLVLAFPVLFANSINSYIEKADNAYLNNEYSKALNLYKKAEKEGGNSSELYYNMANCHYRLKEVGKAILYYERALNINPSNEDAQTNLEFIRSKYKIDNNIDETNIIELMFNNIGNSIPSNGWAILAIVLFLLFIVSVGIYLFTTSILIKKIGFFGGIFLLVCVFITNYYAFSLRNKVEDRRFAVVTSKDAVISTSPRNPSNKSEEAFSLKEGSKILIMDSVSSKKGKANDVWYDIKANESQRAWINKKDIDII